MSQTTLDLLFQVMAPVGERMSYGTPRGDEPKSDFGNHLQHASSAPGDAGSIAAGDRRSSRDAAVNGCESSSADVVRNGAALTQELADSGSNDSDADASPGVKESNDTPSSTTTDSGGSLGGEPSGSTQGTDVIGSSDSTETAAEDSEEDPDDEAQREAVIAVESAIQCTSVIAANTEIGLSTESGDAAAKETTIGAAASDATSESGASAKIAVVELDTPDAPIDSATGATSAAIKAPTEHGESADEGTPATSIRKLRPAKPKATNQTERLSQGNGPSGELVGIPDQETDATALHRAEKTESAQSERDASSQDSRDADARSSIRQRGDAAAALAGKIAAVAVPNGAGPQTANNLSQIEANEGASRAGDSAAKLAAVGNGAHGLQAHAGTSKRSNRVNGDEEMPRIDPARFVGRVAKAFHTAQERGGTLQIRLSPPELGAIRLELSVKDGVMTAALETETASARRVLLEHLPALRDRLAEQNIRVERFDVDVRREGTGGQADPRGAQDQQQPYQQQRSEPRRLQTRVPPIAETARQIKPIAPAPTGDTGINLVA